MTVPEPFDTAFAHYIYKQKYAHPGEEWEDTSRRVVGNVMAALQPTLAFGSFDLQEATERVYRMVAQRRFCPGGRYLANSGRPLHQVNNCLLLNVGDSRKHWATLEYKAAMALMTGAGIGVYYGQVRESGATVEKTGGVASGPVPLMEAVNSKGRAYIQGGNRRSAIWAGLPWWHPDTDEFMRAKDWPDWLREQKALDPTVPAPLDMTNISVCLDDEFFAAYEDPQHPRHALAQAIYSKTVDKMVTTGEPGFSVDRGSQSAEKLRNACTEIVSADDSDVCNLGSVVLPRFNSPEEFGQACRDAVLFLTAGSVYSDLPYVTGDLPPGHTGVEVTREKNRRLGLGIIGIHEFVMKAGARYGTDEAFEVLEPYMQAYARATEYARDHQAKLGLSESVAARAEAPNGTIGIVMESTPSGDPLFSAAEKRLVRNSGPRGDKIEVSYVVDPTAARLLQEGVPPNLIEDAHEISFDYERRFAAQEFQQRFTDQAVSSTVNLPHPITDGDGQRAFRDTLYPYLKRLRGITCYPDGARGGQPRSPVPLEYALENQGVVFATDDATCGGGVCGA